MTCSILLNLKDIEDRFEIVGVPDEIKRLILVLSGHLKYGNHSVSWTIWV